MDEMKVQNTSEQNTTDTMETQQEATETAETETVPQDGQNDEETSAQGGGNSDAAEENNAESDLPFLEIKYNHEKRGLTREEATVLAQRGIHYEDTIKALERFATLKGQTVKEFVNGLEAAEDEAHRNELIERFGDDEDTVNQLMELYTINKEKTLTTAKKSREQAAERALQTENERIADEFSKMKSEFPELSEFQKLPESVKKAALSGMPLEYAYLKHIVSEQKKIDAAKLSQQKAAEKTTGSLSTDEKETFYGTKFLNALWRK